MLYKAAGFEMLRSCIDDYLNLDCILLINIHSIGKIYVRFFIYQTPGDYTPFVFQQLLLKLEFRLCFVD